MEGRDIMTEDIPNAFIQVHVPESPDGERIVMKIRGVLVDWLIELDPVSYTQFVVYENGKKFCMSRSSAQSMGCWWRVFFGIGNSEVTWKK